LRVWEDDGVRISALETNDETVGFNSGQIGWINAIGISNIVHSAKVLQCPFDKETPTTTNPAGLEIRISYFLNLDANEGYPQELLDGDDNFDIGGVRVRPGILNLSSNTLVSWAPGRHGSANNIGLADGSVEQQSSSRLQNAIQYSFEGTPSLTNRIAIP
jgi:prepilin-type processing-associated H-X9-DG protein